MKSKIWWPRVLVLVMLSSVVMFGLIAATPTLVSDWIFRTGQEMIRTYNSSTQLIETVDNRNKGRRQYGPLTVDGALYANGAINATGAINIGPDVSLSRSAADVLTIPDSIVGQATQTIYENVIIGNNKTKKLIFDSVNNFRIINAVSYSSGSTNYTGMIKITLPLYLTPSTDTMFSLKLYGDSYTLGAWESDISTYLYYSVSYYNSKCKTRGYCPFSTVKLGYEGNRSVVILGSPTTYFGRFSLSMDVTSKYSTTYSRMPSYMGDYSVAAVSDISGVTVVDTITASNLPDISGNGLVIGTNKTTLTAGYVLDVSGAAYVSGTIYGAGTISGGTLVDRTDASKEDAITEVKKWSVVGNEVDHTSLGDCAVDLKEVKTGFEVMDKAGNKYNSLEEKVVPAKGSKEKDIQALSGVAEKLKEGVAELSAEYRVKEVSRIVETKGRNISKTISTLSRAIQQLSERLDKLEGR